MVDWNKYRAVELLKMAGGRQLSDRLIGLYKQSSDTIHGRKQSNKVDAKKIFQETVEIVQKLYK